MRHLCFLIVCAVLTVPASAANFFVVAGGAGNCSGSSWTNAAGKIPSVLAAGDTVYIGGSSGNLASLSNTPCPGERIHSFSTSGTSGAHIEIIKCTASTTACTSAAGWQASFGTANAQWIDPAAVSSSLVSPFWSFCPGSFYDVTGSVGTADQTGTYGFYMQSAGRMFGFIKVDSHDCGEQNISNLNFQFIEINGVEANSTVGGTQSGANGLYLGSPVSTSATVTSLSFTNAFIHDVWGPISSAGNVTGLTVANDWIYTNFSDAAQHSNAIDCNGSAFKGSSTCLSNLDVHRTVFRNIQGTGVIMCLTGQCNNWTIYSNIVFYTSDWDSICEHGDTTATCGMSKFAGDNAGSGTCNSTGTAGCVTNSVFYGNTFANIHLKPGHAGADEAGILITQSLSSGNNAQNNLWWNSTNAGIFTDIGAPAPVTHDFNRWLNTGAPTTTLNTHDFQTGTAPGGVAVNPFVNSSCTAAGGGCDFHLTSETVDTHLNDGNPLASPFNLDYASNVRGTDGTWERGALEFTSGSAPPAAPTGLTAVVH